MAQFNIPKGNEIKEMRLENFLGVDFTTEISDVDIRRSPDALNMVNEDGYLQKFKGFKQVFSTQGKINGIWNMDTANGEVVIVHAGTKLYEVDTDFGLSVQIMTGLNDNISKGAIFGGKLLILDGKRIVVYGRFGNSYEARYLDTIGYIPTTRISMDPATGGGTDYEPTNMVQGTRINSFLGTSDDIVYKLDCENIDSVDLVEVLDANGNFNPVNNYSVDKINGKVTFTTAPGTSPGDNVDNVRIKFTIRDEDYISQINKCTIFTMFGYSGNNNRIFISGNSDYPNVDWYSEIDEPLYFPDTCITRIGLDTSPIKAYCRVNDGRLAILKDVSDTDCTIYYRTSSMFNGEEIFPLESGTQGTGCISNNACATVQNESFFLSKQGVYSITSTSKNDERYSMLRSYYANGKLLKEANLGNAIATEYDGQYYLAINNRVYIGDVRYKTYEKDSKTSGYQYEWYLLDNIPVRVWFVWNYELYFGTADGKICKFKNNNDTDLYKNISTPVRAYWKTPMLYFNNYANSKTIKKVIVAHNPKVNSEIELYYNLNKGIKEAIAKSYSVKGSIFPKVLQVKKKAKKFMFVQLELNSGNAVNMSFISIIIQFLVGGKYRGE